MEDHDVNDDVETIAVKKNELEFITSMLQNILKYTHAEHQEAAEKLQSDIDISQL